MRAQHFIHINFLYTYASFIVVKCKSRFSEKKNVITEGVSNENQLLIDILRADKYHLACLCRGVSHVSDGPGVHYGYTLPEPLIVCAT